MLFQKSRIVVIVCIMLVALCLSAGCLTGNQLPPVQKATIDLKFEVKNATSGGYLLIPMLFEDKQDVPANVTVALLTSDATCELTSNMTEKGKMVNISLDNGSCIGEGNDSIREPDVRNSEDYLKYYWSTTNQTRPKSLPVFVSYPDTNLSVVHTLDIKISFSGKSNYCSRTAVFAGTLFQSGTWQEVPGSDSAACR